MFIYKNITLMNVFIYASSTTNGYVYLHQCSVDQDDNNFIYMSRNVKHLCSKIAQMFIVLEYKIRQKPNHLTYFHIEK